MRSIVALAFLALGGAACGGSPEVPAELIGTWRTESPPYEGRTFEISPDTIRFDTGGGELTAHPIGKLEAWAEGGGVAYDLRYDSWGKAYTLSFVWEPPGTIVFRHQPGMEWRRGSSPDPR